MNRKVSVLIPTLRKHKIEQLERWIIERAGVPRSDIEILYNTDDVGFARAFKTLVQMASHDRILFVADDCEPEQNFLLCALKTMQKFEGNWGLVGLNCGRWHITEEGRRVWLPFLDHNEIAQHWLGHKKLLKHLGGEFFHTGYEHCFCDLELTQRCKQIKRYKFCEKAMVIHHHPLVMGDDRLWDEVNRPRYDQAVYERDKQLFEARRANGWKTPKAVKQSKAAVVVAVPLHGEGFNRFWTNLARMQFKSLLSGVDTLLQKKSSADIGHARNMLVSEGMRRFPEASHFMFVDADQTFPDDILLRLLAHDKDIVTVNIYRKGPPHFPVVSIQGEDDDYFKPIHIKPQDGSMRPVTSAGTGIVLIKRRVFETMTFPWFKSEYIDPVGEDWESQNLIEGKLFVSEDNRFYVIASALGFKIHCDFSIEIGHLGIYEYSWRDHERCLQEKPELREVSGDGKRKPIDDEDADRRNGGDRDQQHDQPGIKRRLQEAAKAP